MAPLRGKHLVCFCAPKPCHADLLLKRANVAPPASPKEKPAEAGKGD